MTHRHTSTNSLNIYNTTVDLSETHFKQFNTEDTTHILCILSLKLVFIQIGSWSSSTNEDHADSTNSLKLHKTQVVGVSNRNLGIVESEEVDDWMFNT